MTSFKSKVQSEMEILEKNDRLITRYFQESRHTEDIVGIKEDLEERDIWRRYCKDRMKTVSVALVLCLHIGVDPPDSVPKPAQCAKLEAWVDPYSCSPQKAAFKIANSLQKSYERWQPRARYKTATDPTWDDVRKLCVSMRRNAKEERVLFHYNGHGVPRPTQNGEIWVFNKTFTQYIPLSIFDLQLCMEYPSIYVWDCASAETIVNSFIRFANDHESEWHKKLMAHQETATYPLPAITSEMTVDQQAEALKFQRRPRFSECIQLAACRIDERLPTNPDLPADLFTSCLTTPIQMSILWYLIKSGRKSQFPSNLIEEIPGQLSDRRTILGELNWIFTAITDTIAWNTLPRDDFQRLFRQDLLLASLFRSFLLAERIMAANGCNVVSSPALPSTADHPLWDSWEYTLDLTLNHIHNLLVPKINFQMVGRDMLSKSNVLALNPLVDLSGIIGDPQESQHNWFFIEQLRAFEVWLEYGVEKEKSPHQLPVVLQVLLSQAHRQRALELLARFLDLGQWAVGYSLSVGIFPYVLKLLQSTSRELRPWLAFIWAKILAVDPSVQSELFKENGDEQQQRFESNHRTRQQLRYHFFVTILNDPETPPRQKIVVAFVLATLFHNNYKIAQENLTSKGYVNLCTELLSEPMAKECRLLKLWILIGLGRLWADYNEARWQAVRLVAYEKVLRELDDNAPEVRAAAVYALGCLVKNRSESNEHAAYIDQEVCDGLCNKCTRDGSVLVREELLVALQWYIVDFEHRFAKIFWDLSEHLNITISETDDGVEQDSIDIAATIKDSDVKRSVVSISTRKPPGYRRRKQTSESSVGVEEVVCFGDRYDRPLLETSHSQVFSVSAYSGPASNDIAYRERANKQVAYLEAKTFKEPLERTWLSLLRLSLDPIEKVARMAQQLIRRIEVLAVTLQTYATVRTEKMVNSASISVIARSADLQPPVEAADHSKDSGYADGHHKLAKSDEGDRGGVRFMIGSPIVGSGALPWNDGHQNHTPMDGPVLVDHDPVVNGHPPHMARSPLQPPERKLSMPAHLTSTPKGSEPRSGSQLMDLLKSSFTPKRIVTARGQFTKTNKDGTEIVPAAISTTEAMLSSEFVPWCSRIFVEPILDLIQREDSVDDFTDRVLTLVNPTDWASFVEEGQRQQADAEFDNLRIKTSSCDSQLVAARVPRQAVSLCFSLLRKCIYSTDGDYVNITRYEKSENQLVRRFACNGGNPFTTDKTCSLIVINELSREMLMCGSSTGVIRIWDPSFNIHSHDIEDESHMVTASHPLCDQTRLSTDGRNSTLYDWSQGTGRLICGGNVRVVRIWDAHYERTVQDISIVKKGAATALSGELDTHHLVAIGFRDGSIHVHDTRLPMKESTIMSLHEQSHRIVGVAIRSDGNNRAILAAGSEDGCICVWEPRMYKEPIVDLSLSKESWPQDEMRDFIVHANAQIFGCWMASSQLRVFDISGRSLSSIRQSDFDRGRPLANMSAVAMHKMRCMIAIGSEDGCINVYGQPKTIL